MKENIENSYWKILNCTVMTTQMKIILSKNWRLDSQRDILNGKIRPEIQLSGTDGQYLHTESGQ